MVDDPNLTDAAACIFFLTQALGVHEKQLVRQLLLSGGYLKLNHI